MSVAPVLVRPCRSRLDFERRVAQRHECQLDATTQTLEASDTLAWGATVRDLSCTGVGLILCFPFRAGTYLAVDIHGQTHLTRVAHVRDRNDGTWHVGCEFVKPLCESALEAIL